MKYYFTLFFLILTQSLSGQININDSSVQVVGYWDKGEKQSYDIRQLNYKVKGADTTERYTCQYKVDISIKDSTDKMYLIEWSYHDFKIDSEVELVRKIGSLTKDFTMIILTNELGEFQEVVNWKQMRDLIQKGLEPLKDELSEYPELKKLVAEMNDHFKSKEAIEASAINEVQQFYFFHGLKLEIEKEIRTTVQLDNLLGGKPFDAEIAIWIDELDEEDGDYVLRMTKDVDSKQLTDATYNYLTELSKSLKTTMPSREEFPALQNKTWTALRVHDSGWPIYGVETKEVSGDGFVKVEECTIELQ